MMSAIRSTIKINLKSEAYLSVVKYTFDMCDKVLLAMWFGSANKALRPLIIKIASYKYKNKIQERINDIFSFFFLFSYNN